MTEAAPARTGAGLDGRAIALAVGETIIWAGTYYLFPALLTGWAAAEPWDRTTLAASFTAALVISAFGSPLAGRYIDRGHGRAVLTGSAVGAAALLVVLAFVDSELSFALVWLGIGVCMAGGLYDPCFAFLVRTRGERARRAITAVTLIAGFAGTLSFPVNGFIAEAHGWRTAVLTFAGLVALIAAPCFWIGTAARSSDVITPPANPDARRDEPFRRALARPTFWLLAACFALLYLNHGTVITHLLPLLAERGVPFELAIATASMIGPMQVTGRVLMVVLDRWVSVRVLSALALSALTVSGLALMFAGTNLFGLAVFAVGQGCGVGICSITRPVVTAELLGRESFGAIAGAISMPVMLCMAAAPSSGTFLWRIGGYDTVLNINLAVALTALGCYLLALRAR